MKAVPWLKDSQVCREKRRLSLEHFGTCLLLGESVPANANAADAPTADAAAIAATDAAAADAAAFAATAANATDSVAVAAAAVAATAIGANANATNGAGAKGFQALPCSFRSSLRTITVRCRIGKPCLDLCLLSLST